MMAEIATGERAVSAAVRAVAELKLAWREQITGAGCEFQPAAAACRSGPADGYLELVEGLMDFP